MALISCPECGHRVSSRASFTTCPSCGFPLQRCPHCQGSGKRVTDADIAFGDPPTHPCYWCRGTGIEIPDMPPPDIGTIFDP